jgi:hypothetical protein
LRFRVPLRNCITELFVNPNTYIDGNTNDLIALVNSFLDKEKEKVPLLSNDTQTIKGRKTFEHQKAGHRQIALNKSRPRRPSGA